MKVIEILNRLLEGKEYVEWRVHSFVKNGATLDLLLWPLDYDEEKEEQYVVALCFVYLTSLCSEWVLAEDFGKYPFSYFTNGKVMEIGRSRMSAIFEFSNLEASGSALVDALRGCGAEGDRRTMPPGECEGVSINQEGGQVEGKGSSLTEDSLGRLFDILLDTISEPRWGKIQVNIFNLLKADGGLGSERWCERVTIWVLIRTSPSSNGPRQRQRPSSMRETVFSGDLAFWGFTKPPRVKRGWRTSTSSAPRASFGKVVPLSGPTFWRSPSLLMNGKYWWWWSCMFLHFLESSLDGMFNTLGLNLKLK
jgi:hypothetical protein